MLTVERSFSFSVCLRRSGTVTSAAMRTLLGPARRTDDDAGRIDPGYKTWNKRIEAEREGNREQKQREISDMPLPPQIVERDSRRLRHIHGTDLFKSPAYDCEAGKAP